MIPDSFKQDLLNRVDVVDVISARVPLRKSGANWIGLCPFHGEKTPSFTVSQTKQFYHCFGCGAHGNAIGFLMEYSGLGYVEAVKELADSVGMKLPELRSEDRKPRPAPEGPDLYELLAAAARYYRESLKAAPRAIEYLKGRGLTGKTAARFGMGYAPAGWQNLGSVFTRYEDKALVECGLVIENEGKRYDRFRDRVMFPILNQRGIVVGFGGRLLEGEESAAADGKGPGPKYLNSPETPVFEKGRELYGLPQAREAIRATNRVVVVEGYMDVVMLAQHGVENAVATLGTATTPVHVQKLLRQADDVVFCFDGDAAGRRAAWHALEVSLECLADRKALRFLFLPAEHDPDSYVRAFGREAFEREAARAQPLSEFLLATLTGRVDLATLEGRSRLIAEAKPLVRRVAAPALRAQLVRALADAAAMSPAELARLMELRDAVLAAPNRAPPVPDERAAAVRSNEAKLLRALLAIPELAGSVPVELLPAGADAAALRAVVEALGASGAGGGAPRPVSSAFEGAAFYGMLTRLEADLIEFKLEPEDLRAEFEGAVRNLRGKANTKEINEMLARKQKEGLPERLLEGAALRQAPAAPALARDGENPI